MNAIRIGAVVMLAFLLSACAGTNFVRPPEDKLVLGTTTKSQIVAMLGEPFQKGQQSINGANLELYSYGYANVGAPPVFEGVTAARHLNFSFNNDVLVGKSFNSTFKNDTSYFPPDKAKAVKQGMTRAEVINLVGQPTGEAIYPVVQNPKGKGLIYVYNQARGFTFGQRLLTVELDEKGIVERTSFTEAGEFEAR